MLSAACERWAVNGSARRGGTAWKGIRHFNTVLGGPWRQQCWAERHWGYPGGAALWIPKFRAPPIWWVMEMLKRTAWECRSFLMSWDNDRWNSGSLSAEFHQNNSTQVQDGGQLANSRGTELILAGDRDSIMPQSLQRPFSDGAGLEPRSFSIKEKAVSQLTDMNLWTLSAAVQWACSGARSQPGQDICPRQWH